MRPVLLLLCLLWPAAGLAQDNSFRLAAPQEIADSGFLRHLLPRFALKHGIRIAQVGPDDAAEARFGAEGRAVFAGLGKVWHLSHDGSAQAARFEEWLLSDIGRTTIEAFAPGGTPLFAAETEAEVAAPAASFDGDPVAGERLALAHCGRCHVINDSNRMKGMGATPSFGVLRTLPEWENRFAAFYALNPHPSFTQVADVTLPFDAALPPPIFPVRIDLQELDAILAYVATIPPADLGAPIQSQ